MPESSVLEQEAGDIKRRIDILKAHKAHLGRSIRLAKEADSTESVSNEVDGLVLDLKTVSDELKRLQKSLKHLIKSQRKVSEKRWTPISSVPGAQILTGDAECVDVVDFFTTKSKRSAIDAYVACHEGGSIWHTTTSLEFISSTYGHRVNYLYATDSADRIVGVLPLVQLKSKLFGNLIVSVPYFNYGGLLCDSHSVADTLIERAKEWRDLLGANSVELRHCSNSELGNPQRGDKLTYWLSLPNDTQSLWDSFQPKVRAQIRRGEKEEPVIEFGTVELLDDFYEVFSRNMRDLGTPVYSKSFFKNLLVYLEGSSQLVIARVGGKVVGCAYIVGFGERMEIPWASTLREYNHTCINMVMYWRILEHAIAANYRLFDFGRCSQDAGTARFKQQWGATPIPLHWDYLLEHGNCLPALNPNNPKFRLMIAVWKRLPVWVTRIVGPGIVKYLP